LIGEIVVVRQKGVIDVDHRSDMMDRDDLDGGEQH